MLFYPAIPQRKKTRDFQTPENRSQYSCSKCSFPLSEARKGDGRLLSSHSKGICLEKEIWETSITNKDL